MLVGPSGGLPRSSSSPSTTSSSRPPAASTCWAAFSSSRIRWPCRSGSTDAGGFGSPTIPASCAISASVYAALSAWPASRPVMKNHTTRTPAGGCNTSHEASAVLPYHGSARHHWYASSPAQKPVSAANSLSRPSNDSGAISSIHPAYVSSTISARVGGATSGSSDGSLTDPSTPANSSHRRRGSWRYTVPNGTAASRFNPSPGCCSLTTPTIRPAHHTAAPDMPSHGERSGSGARAGGSSTNSRVPSRQFD